MGLKVPFVAGHGTADEILGWALNPISSIQWDNFTVGGVSQELTAKVNRKSVLFWVNSIPDHAGLWINLGGAVAVVGEGIKLTGGVFGLDIAEALPISFIGTGGDIEICVIQFGGSE